jgi:hypothetical protein
MGKLGGFLEIDRATASPERDPRERVGDYREFVGTLPVEPSCASRARAAWSAACRSATTAARSAT